MKLSLLFTILLLCCTSLFASSILKQNQDCLNYMSLYETPEQQQLRSQMTTLKISTYNAYWLFDGISDRTAPWSGSDEATEHTKNIAKIVSNLQADFVNLVEVESCSMMQQLNGFVEEEQKDIQSTKFYPFLLPGRDTATNQNVALLSKVIPSTILQRTEDKTNYPTDGGACSISGTRTSGVSKHFYSFFQIRSLDFLLVSVHLKAFPTDRYSCSQREAQAYVIRDLIRGLKANYTLSNPNKSLSVIVLGDFNDYDPEVLDINNNVPNSRVLEIIKDKNNTDLINVASILDIPKAELYSNWWDKNNDSMLQQNELSLIDHILVSRHMAKAIFKVEMNHDFLTDAISPVSSDQYTSVPLKFSDHWPVSFSVDLVKLRTLLLVDSNQIATSIVVFWLSIVMGSLILTAYALMLVLFVVQKVDQKLNFISKIPILSRLSAHSSREEARQTSEMLKDEEQN